VGKSQARREGRAVKIRTHAARVEMRARPGSQLFTGTGDGRRGSPAIMSVKATELVAYFTGCADFLRSVKGVLFASWVNWPASSVPSLFRVP